MVHKTETHLQILWHHILLDGLGISVLLNDLVALLDNQEIVRKYAIYSLIEESRDNERFKLKTISTPSNMINYRIIENELDEIKNVCKINNIDISTFFHATVSKAHGSSAIAVADITNHPGIPGMFTELKTKNFNVNATTIQDLIKAEKLNHDNEIAVVSNFMIIDSSSALIKNIESKKINYTKYAYEWQFVQHTNFLEVSFYFSTIDLNALDIHKKWNQIFNEMKTGRLINEESIKTNKDVFDDFDF